MRDFSVDKIFAALSKMPAKAESFLREGTINGVNFTDADGFPMQFNPDTACGGSGFLGETCDFDATFKRQPGWPAPVELSTFNHVRMVVKDIDSTIAWYTKADGHEATRVRLWLGSKKDNSAHGGQARNLSWLNKG
jgi:hypothetical protein